MPHNLPRLYLPCLVVIILTLGQGEATRGVQSAWSEMRDGMSEGSCHVA